MTELIISGRVQGVFCRHYCSQNARKLGIRGSASNLHDGTVCVLLDTDEDSLIDRYTRALRENPYGVRFFGTITGISLKKNIPGTLNGDYVF